MMKVLISGGAGFLGRQLADSLVKAGHQVRILSRTGRSVQGTQSISWNMKTILGWDHALDEIDAVVNLAGKSLSAWPWTARTKREFHDSRVTSGRLLVEAIRKSDRKPAVFIQASGINHYGFAGTPADESTPPGDDFLSKLTVDWEAATRPVEEFGVRRVVVRSAVVLGRGQGLLPRLELPIRSFVGGPIGAGTQALPWIHIHDWIAAVRFVIERQNARGAFNFIAPESVTSAEFMRSLAGRLHRPFWLRVPATVLRIFLGEMSVLLLEGRQAVPTRLMDAGYRFTHPTLESALSNLYHSNTQKENSV